MKLPTHSEGLINSLAYDKFRQCYWVGTEHGLLGSKDLRGFYLIPQVLDNSIKTILNDRHGDLLLGTDHGIFCQSLNGMWTHYSHEIDNQNSLANNIVWSLFNDVWGNIWVATDNGVSFLSADKLTSLVSLRDVTGLKDGNVIHTIYRQRNDVFWLGGTNGLIRYDRRSKSCRWFLPKSRSNFISHSRVRRIYQDREGDIWVATDHGLNYFDPKTNNFRYFVVTDKTGRYNCNWCYDVLEDRWGRLWIAAYQGGIFIISKKRLLASNGTCVADRHLSNTPKGLGGIHIGQLNQDREGMVWAMVFGYGLDRIDPKNYHVEHVFENINITYTIVDEQGHLWAGFKGGVARIGRPGTKPDIYPFNDGINPQVISTMIAARGKIWVFSDNVVRVIQPGRLKMHFHLPVSGICAYYSPQYPFILVGSNDLIAQVDPSTADRSSEGHLLLVALSVNGKEYQHEGRNFMDLNHITLSHSENNLLFQFTDIPYSPKRRSIYLFNLKNNNRWIPIQNFRSGLALNALPSGHYTLVVRSIDDPQLERAFRFSFTIRPPWYASTWAYLVYLLLLLALIWAGVHFYSVRRMLSQERSSKKNLMEQSQAKAEFFSLMSSKLKNPISRILIPAGQKLIEGTGTENDVLRRIVYDAFDLNRLVYNSLDADGELLEPVTNAYRESINVPGYIQLILDRYNKRYDNCTFRLDNQIGQLYKETDAARFGLLIGNLLMYVSSQGGTTVVTLRRDKNQETFSITIANDSLRISESERNTAFQRYPLSSSDKPNLFVIRRYAEEFNGRMEFDANNHFVLTYPIQEQVLPPVTEQSTGQDKLFSEANFLIEEHISDSSFNVTKLQEELGVGDKLLYRRIKAFTGMSPVEYIRNTRLKKAALLLKEGKYSVTEVMYMVGFSNSGYFSKCFQRIYGTTPKDYASGKQA